MAGTEGIRAMRALHTSQLAKGIRPAAIVRASFAANARTMPHNPPPARWLAPLARG